MTSRCGTCSNEQLPAVDLVANYGLQGLGGTQFIRQGTGLGSQIIDTIPGGYVDALGAIRRASFPTWNVGLTVSYPLFASAADARYARARVERNQALAEIRALELQVATDVTSAGLQVESNLKRVEAGAGAREARGAAPRGRAE
jgi:outer membrane protein TolC